MHFNCQEREKKHKQSIADDNPTIIYLHEPYHIKDSTAAHLVRR